MLTGEFHTPMTRALIEAQSKDFEQMFARRYAKYGIVSELDELAQSRQKVYIFSGVIRDFFLQLDSVSRDIDIVISGKSLDNIMENDVRVTNQFGGVTDGYFLRAIEFCNEKFHPKKYRFFSDEPDWVEQNICNYITQPYEIMRGNKAWEDLWLLAHCPIIVASQGSFGKVAARLNSDAVLIQCDNERANHARKNTFLIK